MNVRAISIGVAASAAVIAGAHLVQSRLDAMQTELTALRLERRAHEEAPALDPPPIVRETSPAWAPPPATAPQLAPAPATLAAPKPTPTPEEQWAKDSEAYRTSVEATFAGQTGDRAWAADARRELTSRLRAALPAASTLGDVDCRATMCRVALVLPDAAAERAFEHKALLDPKEPAWNGPAFLPPAERQPDGSVAVVMYLGRDGDSLAAANL